MKHNDMYAMNICAMTSTLVNTYTVSKVGKIQN